MAVFDILPQTNLSGNDIRDTLASGGGNVGNSASSWFKPEAKINMWSKKKPVKYRIENTEGIDWWKGQDGNLGFIIPIMNSISELPAKNWSYDFVDSDWAKRMGDFRGYSKNSDIFVRFGENEITVNSTTGVSGFTINGFSDQSLDHQIGLSDFSSGNIGGMYVTSCIKIRDNYYIKSSESTFKDGGLQISWTWAELGGSVSNIIGSWDIFVVLSTIKYSTAVVFNDIVNKTISPIPHNNKYKNPFKLNVILVTEIAFYIEKLGTFYGNLEPKAYYDLDESLLSYDQDGNPIYAGDNALRSNGIAYLQIKVENKTNIAQNVILSDLYFRADNFRQQLVGRFPTVVYTDTGLSQQASLVSIPANSFKYVYARDNYFARLQDGSGFVPTSNQVIAPANLTFYKGATGTAFGSVGGIVIKAPQ